MSKTWSSMSWCRSPIRANRSGTVRTVPDRFARIGDLHHDIDDHVFDIAPLLEWAARDEKEGAEPPPEPED